MHAYQHLVAGDRGLADVPGADCGFVVPFADAAAARDAVLKLDADPDLRVKMGLRAHDAAKQSLGWPADARAFVTQLESWAAPRH